VPVSALWDGRKFLAEVYPTSILTRSSIDKLRDPPPEGPAEIRALATTVARPPFSALPGAGSEVEAILKDSGGSKDSEAKPEGASETSGKSGTSGTSGAAASGTATGTGPESEGVLSGRSYFNDDFNLDTLSDCLASKAQVVHIASHFLLEPGNMALSRLLLGNGDTLTLADIRSKASLDFKGLDILTLSACNTASGYVKGDGAEVEGFGEIVQGRGASAVLASLWPVDDSSTSALMREFYRLRYTEGMGKAEALRGAQAAVMRSGPGGAPGAERAPGTENRGAALGSSAAGSADSGGTGNGATGSASPPRWTGTGWSHPYFWAPFVLMGNWR
jgi:CHAT domain-containing protein